MRELYVTNPVEQRAFAFGTPVVVASPRERMGAEIDDLIGRFAGKGRIGPKRAGSHRARGAAGMFFDGSKWRRKGRAAAKKGGVRRRRRSGARDSRGRFLPRKRKAAARRAAPKKRRGLGHRISGLFTKKRKRRAVPKRRRTAARRRLGRDSRGRFLKRGRAGTKRRAGGGRRLSSLTPKYIARARRRKGVRKHLRARRTIRPGMRIAGLVRINPRTGAIIMSRAKVANPSRKHRKHRRRHHHARRAHNPGMGGLISTAKAAMMPMAAGTAAGALAGYVDTKFLANRPTVSVLAKVGLGIVGALALRRKHAAAAMGFAGGMLGATGYTYGVKFAGGHVALNGMQGLRGLADMAASDPETANLIAGLADVVPDNGMGDATSDYDQALSDADDQVADIVED